MLGKRYGMLPSELVQRATTFDLLVMDASMEYQNYIKNKDKPGYVPDIPLEDLIKMKERVK
jgi:hypothetical protein